MSFLEYAMALLEEARVRLESAKIFLERGKHSYVVRQSQECVELSIKAALRVAGIEYPKRHELSDLLLEEAGLYPSWFAAELAEVSRISKELMRKRAPSMYGEEALGRPPRSLFERGDAESSIEGAERVFGLVERLLNEWKGHGASKIEA
ncbi:MAG: HEPN domain-containing protein [Candidatus Bathyarchaeia archaeon]